MIELRQDLFESARKQFAQSANAPFPYAVIDGMLPEDIAQKCSKEFLALDKNGFVTYSDPDFEYLKSAQNNRQAFAPCLGQVFDFLHSDTFVSKMEFVTGFNDLKVDEKRWGGGLHMTAESGYLAVHKDFSVLPTTFKAEKQFLRTLNIIGYLTPGWQEDWGGHLEFWNAEGTKCIEKIAPKANRWVIFDTRETYHGHPWPYKGKTPRISMATYYYQAQPVARDYWKSTDYLKLPWKDETPEYMEKRKKRASAELRYGDLLPK